MPHVIMSVRKPSITLFGNFLSDTECDQLIEEARPHLSISSVYTPDSPQGTVDTSRRSSIQTQMSGERRTVLSQMIDERTERFLQLPGWALTVLNYPVGAKFIPHIDAYSPKLVQEGKVPDQRVGSLIVYLNDMPIANGGSTRFPRLGFDFRPIKGNAVFFTYTPEDMSVEHESIEVRSGEKWAMVKWFYAKR